MHRLQANTLSQRSPVAIVGRAEHCHHLLFMLPQEAFTDQLVSADDEAQPIDMVEVLAYVLQAQQQQ